MPSRRTHSKSRHGCAQCKLGHVKCDLRRPACGKCTRTGKDCEFANPLNAQPCITPTTLNSQITPVNPPPAAAISFSGNTTLHPAGFGRTVDMISWDDLELLHYYSTVTYATLARREDILQMWKFEVPRMSLKQRFLMHSLLGVAALHKASAQTTTNQISYLDKAIQHHNIALREYRSNLDCINKENSTALFVCAALIVVFALGLAVLRPHDELSDSVEEISGIFMLLRGVQVMLQEMWLDLEGSEIGPLFSGREDDNATLIPGDIADAVRRLEDRNRSMSDEEGNKQTYSMAIHALKNSFKLLSAEDRHDGMFLSWPTMVGPAYIALLVSRRPMALVILAHYAVILHEVRNTWWARAWGQHLVQDVDQIVDDDWKILTAWPLKMVQAPKPMGFPCQASPKH